MMGRRSHGSFRDHLLSGRYRVATAVLFGILTIGGMLLRLFVPHPVGMADNGDGARLMCQLGAGTAETSRSDVYNNWAILDYHASPEARRTCIDYPSSTKLLMQLWMYLSHLTGSESLIDLRTALAAFAVFVGLAVLALCLVFRSPIRQGVASLILVAILGDATFADYLASPFTETAGLVGVMGVAITGVYVGAFRSRPVMTWIGLAAFLGFAYLMINSKTQTITTLVPVALFLLWHAVRMTIAAVRAKTVVSVLGAIAALAVAVAGPAALGASALDTYGKNPKEFAVINPTEVIFVGILGSSSDPESDLRAMGLPESMSVHAGKSWWASETEAPQTDPLFGSVKHKMTYGTVAGFLAKHPDRAVTMLNSATKDYFAARPDYLGNFTKSSGAAAAERDFRFAIPSTVQGAFVGGGLVLFLVLFAGTAAGAVIAIRRSARGNLTSGFAYTALLLAGIAGVQLLTCAYGESIENTKHLVIGILAGMLSGASLIFAFLTDGDRRRSAEVL